MVKKLQIFQQTPEPDSIQLDHLDAYNSHHASLSVRAAEHASAAAASSENNNLFLVMCVVAGVMGGGR